MLNQFSDNFDSSSERKRFGFEINEADRLKSKSLECRRLRWNIQKIENGGTP